MFGALADNRHSEGRDPLVGAVIGDAYRIVRRMGRGGMADLYVGEHVRLHRPLALKVLREQADTKAISRVRFEREAIALSRIRSPHVLQVLDLLTLPDGRPCAINELLEGESLQEHIERRPRPTPLAATRIAQQVAAALGEAHAQGVVHRDVKPSNVFLVRTSTGAIHVKVIDFGVAQLGHDHRSETKTGGLVGTPPYMAPEQVRGQRADERTDVYGVGALLYRLMTGVTPYDAPTPAQVLNEIERTAPPRPGSVRPGLPRGASAIIEKAMSRDPRDRFQTMGELEEALAQLADTLAESERRRRKLTRIEREQRSARPLALFAAALVVASTVAAAGMGLKYLPESQNAVLLMLAGIAVLVATGRSIQRRWRSSTAVAGWSRSVLAALLTGFGAFGALSLLSEAGLIPWRPLWSLWVALIAMLIAVQGKRALHQRSRR